MATAIMMNKILNFWYTDKVPLCKEILLQTIKSAMVKLRRGCYFLKIQVEMAVLFYDSAFCFLTF
jgi:hypothetical protein